MSTSSRSSRATTSARSSSTPAPATDDGSGADDAAANNANSSDANAANGASNTSGHDLGIPGVAGYASKHVTFKGPTLTDPSGYTNWLDHVQDFVFSVSHCNNLDTLKPRDMLLATFFSKFPRFAERFAAAAEAATVVQNDAFENDELVEECYEHATTTGDGFKPWVYTVYTAVRAALDTRVRLQTSGVKRGDLLKLLLIIKLAMHRFEIYSPDDLDIMYTKCCMAEEGQNDLMVYMAAMDNYVARLDAADASPSEAKRMRCLLAGLNQIIFESLINDAEIAPFKSYALLQVAIMKRASRHITAAKLRALRPGQQSFNVTRTSAPVPATTESKMEERLQRMERMMTAIAKKTMAEPPNKGLCFAFKNTGACNRGTSCPFAHVAGAARQQRVTNLHCSVHGPNSSHTSLQCNALRKMNLDKAARAAEFTTTATQQVRAATTENGYDFMFPMRALPQPQHHFMYTLRNGITSAISHFMPQYIMSVRDTTPKINAWCIDSGATCFGTYDRKLCHNIRPCNTTIFGASAEVDSGTMVCTEMGDLYLQAYIKQTGKTNNILLTDVLINAAFPFHIFSEIVAFDRGNTATKSKNEWSFHDQSGERSFNGSQKFINSLPMQNRSDKKLYFIDEPSYASSSIADHLLRNPTVSSQYACRTCGAEQAQAIGATTEYCCITCNTVGLPMPSAFGKPLVIRGPTDNIPPLEPVPAPILRATYNCNKCTFSQISDDNTCLMCMRSQDAEVPSAHPYRGTEGDVDILAHVYNGACDGQQATARLCVALAEPTKMPPIGPALSLFMASPVDEGSYHAFDMFAAAPTAAGGLIGIDSDIASKLTGHSSPALVDLVVPAPTINGSPTTSVMTCLLTIVMFVALFAFGSTCVGSISADCPSQHEALGYIRAHHVLDDSTAFVFKATDIKELSMNSTAAYRTGHECMTRAFAINTTACPGDDTTAEPSAARAYSMQPSSDVSCRADLIQCDLIQIDPLPLQPSSCFSSPVPHRAIFNDDAAAIFSNDAASVDRPAAAIFSDDAASVGRPQHAIFDTDEAGVGRRWTMWQWLDDKEEVGIDENGNSLRPND